MFKWIWRSFFFCFVLLAGWAIQHFLICRNGAYSWDEAGHSLKGVLIAHDFKTGDWLGLLYDTYKQVYWPPMHSWLTGTAFLVWQPTEAVARSVSLFFFLLSTLVIYLAALQLRQTHREIGAVIAALLFLTAPSLVYFSGQALVETSGLFFVSLTVLIYIRLNTKPYSAVCHVWLGVAIALAYFTKTNYGILLILVWLTATWFNGGKRVLFSRTSFYTVLPLIIVFTIWFAYPPKIRSTLAALVNVPWGNFDPYSLQGFLFFPKAVLHFFGSIWQSVIPVIALLLAFKFWSKPAVRFLLLLAVIQFGLALAHHTRDERHICPMFPPMVLITGFVFGEYWAIEGGPVVGWAVRATAIGLCMAGVVVLPRFVQPASASTEPELVADVVDALRNHHSSLVLGTTEIRKPSPPVLDWELVINQRVLPITHAGVAMNFEEDRKIGGMARNLPLPVGLKNSLLRVTSRGETGGQTRSIYLGLVQEYSYAGDVEKTRALLRRMDATDPIGAIVVLTMDPSTRGYPFEFVDEAVRPLGFKDIMRESYPGSRIRVDFYRRAP